MSFISILNCPACGAPVKPEERSCQFCSSTFLATASVESPRSGIERGLVIKAIKKWRRQDSENHYSEMRSYNLGLCFMNLGMLEEAIESFEEAIDESPEYADMHFNLAIAIWSRNPMDSHQNPDFAEAVGNALKLAPNRPEVKALGKFLAAEELRRAKLESCIPEYRDGLELFKELAPLHFGLAIAVNTFNKGLTQAAIAMKRAIELQPSISAYSYLIYYYLKLKEFNSARETSREALELANKSPEVNSIERSLLHKRAARAFWECGERAAAVTD